MHSKHSQSPPLNTENIIYTNVNKFGHNISELIHIQKLNSDNSNIKTNPSHGDL